MKVLVADDDAVNRRRLQTFLEKWGYEVVTARDGEEAWSILRQEDAPRLAILDWMMPGMDGTRICEQVRMRPGAAYTYILLLTAKAQKEDVVAGIHAGADDYLRKPFGPSELRARLQSGWRILELQDQLHSANQT